MRIWDIIDKIQPGVEITQHNEMPVRFPSSGTPLMLSVAGMVLATAAAFCLPIPKQTVIVSAATQSQTAPIVEPPLSFLGHQLSGNFGENENELLDRIEAARQNIRTSEIRHLDVIEANQQESLRQPPIFTRDQVSSILKKRRVG